MSLEQSHDSDPACETAPGFTLSALRLSRACSALYPGFPIWSWFRLIGSPQRWDRSAALASTLHWFETELLTRKENLVGLVAVNRDVVG